MTNLIIQLDDNVAESLRQMAREQNRSEFDLIRDATPSTFTREASRWCARQGLASTAVDGRTFLRTRVPSFIRPLRIGNGPDL